MVQVISPEEFEQTEGAKGAVYLRSMHTDTISPFELIPVEYHEYLDVFQKK